MLDQASRSHSTSARCEAKGFSQEGGSASKSALVRPPAAFADPHCLGVPFTPICRRIDNELAPQSLHVISRCREFFLTHSSFHWWAAWLSPPVDRPVTYLDFDGAGGPDFVPRQWRCVSMQPR